MSDNWVVQNLERALTNWNEKLAELWMLVTQTPESFKGGDIWTVIVGINSAVQGIGYGLLVLFFAMGVFQSASGFRELQRPEFALRHFIRFILAKLAVSHGMELMTAVFQICGGVIQSVMGSMGGAVGAAASLPSEIVTAMEDVSFLESIPLWLVSILGSLFITVMSIILILTVYGRFFKLYLFTALAPVPLSALAGEPTQSIGVSFLKSYTAVCLEGAVIVLSCIIFSLFASSPPVVNAGASAINQVWAYIGELAFNMLVLVGAVKMSDHTVKEMMGI